jgi:hypothetical protein
MWRGGPVAQAVGLRSDSDQDLPDLQKLNQTHKIELDNNINVNYKTAIKHDTTPKYTTMIK